MKVIIGVVIFVFTIISGLQMIEKNKASFYASLNQTSQNQDAIFDEKDIIVSITGNIKKPGQYSMKSGVFLESALQQAGGVLQNTDYEAINLYLLLENDIQIYIPQITDKAKISINEGTIDDLDELPSIGITLANRIVEYRDEIGRFSYLEQLLEVDGIGSNVFYKIRDAIKL